MIGIRLESRIWRGGAFIICWVGPPGGAKYAFCGPAKRSVMVGEVEGGELTLSFDVSERGEGLLSVVCCLFGLALAVCCGSLQGNVTRDREGKEDVVC
jgi:hypothetical protein